MLAGGADSPELEQTAGGPTASIGLGIIAVLLVALYMWSPWAFVFVIGLLISIFLHELGHFVTARWTGMKATQFFLFMGPKLWSFRRGETEYGLRAYPVGAFVRIIGMNNLDEVAPEDEPRAYRNKSYPRRMLVITAGSVMHILIAIALIFGVYAVNGRRAETGRVGIGSISRRLSRRVRPESKQGTSCSRSTVSNRRHPISSSIRFAPTSQVTLSHWSSTATGEP